MGSLALNHFIIIVSFEIILIIKCIILAFPVGAVYLYLLCESTGHAVIMAVAVFCCFLLLMSQGAHAVADSCYLAVSLQSCFLIGCCDHQLFCLTLKNSHKTNKSYDNNIYYYHDNVLLSYREK